MRGIETEILSYRGDLTVSKQSREVLRTDNKELKRQQGFATSDLLLKDFENRKGTLINLRGKINEYQDRYQILLKQVESLTTQMSKQSVVEPFKASQVPMPPQLSL